MPQSPLNFRQKQGEHERNAASGEVPTGGTRSQNSQVEILIADAREDDRRGVNKCVCVCVGTTGAERWTVGGRSGSYRLGGGHWRYLPGDEL